MRHIVTPDYSNLRGLLAEPELFDADSMPVGRHYLHSKAKLLFDTLASLAVLPLAVAPTAAGALAVRVIDHAPVIFRQDRIGHLGKPFTINKITTMPGVSENTHSNGRHNDPRRSRLGNVLSMLRIDESPQLVNVAGREMSIIGPRPLIGSIFSDAHHILGLKRADEWIKVRSLALPGIFDEYSTLHHGHKVSEDEAESLEQRVEIESVYILDKASLTEDARILGNTLALFGSTVIRHTTSMLGVSRD